MDEISKIGDLNSVNDFLDFKLSIKTIIILIFIWIIICVVGFIIFMGGVNNSIAYLNNLLDSTKKTMIEIKNNNKDVDKKKEDEEADSK